MSPPRAREKEVDHETVRDLYREMGEIKAVAREAKHAANNTSQKVDGLSAKFDTLAAVVTRQGALAEAKENHENRISDLEAYRHRQEGAIGAWTWLVKNWPFTLIAIALSAVVLWANGKVAL